MESQEKLERLLDNLQDADLAACSRRELIMLIREAIHTLLDVVTMEEE